jgi:hypothetical protein
MKLEKRLTEVWQAKDANSTKFLISNLLFILFCFGLYSTSQSDQLLFKLLHLTKLILLASIQERQAMLCSVQGVNYLQYT